MYRASNWRNTPIHLGRDKPPEARCKCSSSLMAGMIPVNLPNGATGYARNGFAARRMVKEARKSMIAEVENIRRVAAKFHENRKRSL